ncbi:MAG: MATE family efflux transporter [Clostridia bacterium]|nr:MATE family efflux transporter [Clostridia bacterium]
MFHRLVGDKYFYKRIIMLMLPIMIQNGITNFVNMLDNVMVGRVGTVEMTGVAVTNQLMFVFNLCIFGAVSGAGIFGAQFFGKQDHEGVRLTFRFKMIFCIILCLLGMGVLLFGGENLIGMYLAGDGQSAEAEASLQYGMQYLRIMLIGLIPYTVVQCYSSTLRETGRTVLPMVGGVIAVLINLVLNYVLIFGHFGAPRLGVAGAAIATAVSRFVELAIVTVWTRLHAKQTPFIIGAYRSFYVPGKLIGQIALKGLPLMLNEALWAAGTAMVNQLYSLRGLNVVAADNIMQTFWNVFAVAFMAVGVAIGIVIGQHLGADETEEARLSAGRLVTFSIALSTLVAGLFALAAEFIPLAYNTTDEVRLLATRMMQITALAMPLDACANACYFTLRSGGKTVITFAFDSGFVWLVQAVVAYLLIHFTTLPILPLFAICQALNLIKAVFGLYLVHKGIWVRNIVN